MATVEKQAHYISDQSRVAKDALLESPVRTYGNVTIRRNTKVGQFSFINSGTTLFPRTTMGRFCSVGKNCEIGAFDHPTTWLSSSPFQYNMSQHFPDYEDEAKRNKIRRPGGVTIGNDVWIGTGVIVKRGITIGHGAIIGGGAVVIRDVPDYAIVGGVPAKHIRYRFSPETIDRLLASKWWDLPMEELGDLPFGDIDKTLAQLENATVALKEPFVQEETVKCDDLPLPGSQSLRVVKAGNARDHAPVTERVYVDR